jgi:hypothetical protein
MTCTQCNHPLDEAAEETIEQNNKYAALPIAPICEQCLIHRFNNMETVQ